MKKITFILTIFLSFPAFALFEAKLNYGMLQGKPSLDGLYSGAQSLPSVPVVYGYGLDAIVSPPLLSWGFGLRYESLGFKADTSNLEFKNQITRTALLVNYRLIDTLVYLGPIFTYGISHSGDVTVKENGTEISKFSSKKADSYSIGIEGGVKLIGFLVGAELGYQHLNFKDATDSGPAQHPSSSINMSGSYAKVSVGIGF